MLVGHVDGVRRNYITGWAADSEQPTAHVQVAVLVNGEEWGRVLANAPRDDLRELGTYGDGSHGFIYTFDRPISPLRSYNLVIRAHHANGAAAVARCVIGPEEVRARKMSPVLVTASGRSGTTIMMRRLGWNPSIVIGEKKPFEVKLLTYYSKAFEILSSPGDHVKSAKPDAIYEGQYYLGLNPFHHQLFEGLFSDRRILYDFFQRNSAETLMHAFESIISNFYLLLRDNQKKERSLLFAEKCDIFAPTRRFARVCFDVVKEIVLIRDPRDLYCSYRAFWNMKHEPALQMLRSFRNRVSEIAAEGSGGDVCIVRYEDLVLNPGRSLDGVSKFLQLPESLADTRGVEDEIFRGHGTTKDPISSIGRWRSELSAQEIADLDRDHGEFFKSFGYDAA